MTQREEIAIGVYRGLMLFAAVTIGYIVFYDFLKNDLGLGAWWRLIITVPLMIFVDQLLAGEIKWTKE